MPSIGKVRKLLKQMTEEQRLKLIRLSSLENTKLQIDKVYLQCNNKHYCPHCHSNKICKNGSNHSKGVRIQKFRCNNCKKNYTLKTSTIFHYTHKSIDIWQEYIEYFSRGIALRKIVEKMDKKINLKTAFFWRHKILKVLTKKDNNDKLENVIETDETFFEERQNESRKS